MAINYTVLSVDDEWHLMDLTCFAITILMSDWVSEYLTNCMPPNLSFVFNHLHLATVVQ